MLLNQGFRYNIRRKNNNTISWRCRLRCCQAIIMTDLSMSNIISSRAGHSHNRNETDNFASVVLNKMRKRCREELTSIP